MGENTLISWATHTFNPWLGCTKVSLECDHCYAEREMDQRWGRVKWGAGNPRVRTSTANWKKPLGWDTAARIAGTRPRVFCLSEGDVFDAEVPEAWRDELFAVIAATGQLDWLLLTKRPNVMLRYMRDAGRLPRIRQHLLDARISEDRRQRGLRLIERYSVWPHIWLGVSAGTQVLAEQRIPLLLNTPAVMRFVSCAPLLSRLDLRPWLGSNPRPELDDIGSETCEHDWNPWQPAGQSEPGLMSRTCWNCGEIQYADHGLGWAITEGESGANARLTHPVWVRDLRDQCVPAGIPFHHKQWGEWAACVEDELPLTFSDPRLKDFATACANGFVGDLSLAAAFEHKPSRWPHCFPEGADGDSSCGVTTFRRVGVRNAGRELDGRIWDQVPASPAAGLNL